MAAVTTDDGAAPRPPKSFITWYQWPVLLSIDMIGPFSTDAYATARRTVSAPTWCRCFKASLDARRGG